MSLHADTRRKGTLYYTLVSKYREPDLNRLSLYEPRSLGPVSLSNIETHLLDSLECTEENRTHLVCS